MEKTLVVMGVITMLIGIGFVGAGIIFPDMESNFVMGSVIWTIGGVSAVLGKTVFERDSKLEEFR